jgi:glutaredoxin-related protein
MSTALVRVHPRIAEARSRFHADVVAEVARAVETDKVVVVGMAQNPHVARARKFLDGKGVKYTFLSYGSYLSKWKERLAIKMWAAWPTFPMVFIGGMLVGGASDLMALDKDGELDKLLKG